jgi:hypothetical protein
MLHVRLATPADEGTIFEFIDEAASWLRTKGTDQWSKPWPNREERDDRVLTGLRGNRTWIVENNGIPAATITCRHNANPKLWDDMEQGEPTVYVSQLIVKRSYSGHAMGNELLDWAGKWALRQYDAKWIRIDVWTNNKALHGYYEDHGFRFVRFCSDIAYPSAALFQKSTASLEWIDLPRLKEIPDLLGPLRPVEELLLQPVTRTAANRHDRRTASSLRRLALRCKSLARGHRRLVLACTRTPRLSLSRCRRRLLERRDSDSEGCGTASHRPPRADQRAAPRADSSVIGMLKR